MTILSACGYQQKGRLCTTNCHRQFLSLAEGPSPHTIRRYLYLRLNNTSKLQERRSLVEAMILPETHSLNCLSFAEQTMGIESPGISRTSRTFSFNNPLPLYPAKLI